MSRAGSHRTAELHASTDALTGLPNRRYFDEFCALLARAPPGRGRGRRADDRHRPVQGAQRPLRPRRRGRGPARGRRLDRPRGPRRRRARPLRRRGVRRAAAQSRTGGRARGRRAGARRAWRRSTSRPCACRRSRSRSASPSRSTTTSRSATSSSGPTGRSTGPSATAGTGSWPRSRYHRGVTDDPAELTNGDLARIFHEIGDMLEVKGELVFKTVAYHRAADAIGRSPVDLVAAYRERHAAADPRASARPSATRSPSSRRPAAWPSTSGSRPRSRPGSSTCCASRASAPRPSASSTPTSGIASIDDLRAAAEGGRLRGLRGMSAKTETLMLEGIARLDADPGRMLLDQAETLVDRHHRGDRGHARRAPARAGRLVPPAQGDDRRPRPPRRDRRRGHGSSSGSPALGVVDHVVNQGGYKAAVRLMRGPQVDLMIMPPGEAGTYLVHFTGSKEHNVRLRAMARDQGWSLSEKGFLRIGEDGAPLTGDDGRAADVRHRDRGLRVPRPAVHRARAARGRRRDRGGAGRAGCPSLITQADLRGDLHSHSDWSDGTHADRGHGRGRPPARLRVPGADRPLAVAGHRPRAHPGAGRGAARDRRDAQRDGSPPRRRPARHRPRPRPAASGCSTAASWRSGPTASSTSRTTCSRRFDLVVASLHVVAAPAAGRADPADAQRHPQPARRRHRPPVRPDDRHARRPRPRLGPGLRRGRAHRHGARDERLAASARPRGRACPPRRRRRLRAVDRLGRAPDRRVRLPPLGHQPGAAGLGRARERR